MAFNFFPRLFFNSVLRNAHASFRFFFCCFGGKECYDRCHRGTRHLYSELVQDFYSSPANSLRRGQTTCLVVIRPRQTRILLTCPQGGVVASLHDILGGRASTSRAVKPRVAATGGGRVAGSGTVEAGGAVGAVGRVGRTGEVVVGAGRARLRIGRSDRTVASSCGRDSSAFGSLIHEVS